MFSICTSISIVKENPMVVLEWTIEQANSLFTNHLCGLSSKTGANSLFAYRVKSDHPLGLGHMHT